VKDANGRAYNRTQYLQHRAVMMQRWADYLDTLRNGDEASASRAGPAVQVDQRVDI
jgi:hypothetical protein